MKYFEKMYARGMKMLVIDKTEAKQGGVYVIIDVVHWMAYIGETGNLKGRADNYRRDLERQSGEVNDVVQACYNRRQPLLWHTLLYGNKEKYKHGTDNYTKLENFYIAVFKNYGFSMCNKKQRDMTLDVLKSKYGQDEEVNDLLKRYENALDEDYIRWFGHTISDLKNKSVKEREGIWKKYIEKVETDIHENAKSVYRISCTIENKV